MHAARSSCPPPPLAFAPTPPPAPPAPPPVPGNFSPGNSYPFQNSRPSPSPTTPQSPSSNPCTFVFPNVAKTPVIAAVSVVFPWSTCPIVPTLTCGFVRSNFAFAIPRPPLPLSASAARPALPADPGPRHQGLGDVLRDFLVVGELHRVPARRPGGPPHRPPHPRPAPPPPPPPPPRPPRD